MIYMFSLPSVVKVFRSNRVRMAKHVACV